MLHRSNRLASKIFSLVIGLLAISAVTAHAGELSSTLGRGEPKYTSIRFSPVAEFDWAKGLPTAEDYLAAALPPNPDGTEQQYDTAEALWEAQRSYGNEARTIDKLLVAKDDAGAVRALEDLVEKNPQAVRDILNWRHGRKTDAANVFTVSSGNVRTYFEDLARLSLKPELVNRVNGVLIKIQDPLLGATAANVSGRAKTLKPGVPGHRQR